MPPPEAGDRRSRLLRRLAARRRAVRRRPRRRRRSRDPPGRRAPRLTSASTSTTSDGGRTGRNALVTIAATSSPALRNTVGPFASPSSDKTSHTMAKKSSAPDADPEELAELGGDHDQRNPVDVAEQHRLAEEVRDEPQPQRAGQEEQQHPSPAPAPQRGLHSAPDRPGPRPSPSAPLSLRSAPPASSRARSTCCRDVPSSP